MSAFTRLGLYTNLLITKLTATDTAETFRALSAEVTLKEIPVARVKTVEISAADQTTINTEMGKLEALKVDDELQSLLYQWYGGGS